MSNSSSSSIIGLCCIVIPVIAFLVWIGFKLFKPKTPQAQPLISNQAQNQMPPLLPENQLSNSDKAKKHTPPADADRFRQISPGTSSNSEWPAVYINYVSKSDDFTQEAIHYHDAVSEPALFVSFMEYWPTFRSFKKDQLLWYLYWRTEVRKGNYLKTDLSYIFVYVYELLCLVEIPDPMAAVDRIMTIYKAYVSEYPELKNYLFDWAGDLILTKVGIQASLDWWMHRWLEDRINTPDPIVNAIIADFEKKCETRNMPYPIWAQLNAYRPQNKFYQQYNRDGAIDQAYLKAIQAVDTYLRGLKKPGRILERYVPERLEGQWKYPFLSAVVPDGWHGKIYLGETKKYRSGDRLGMFLLSITKYAENILRKQRNVPARLSGFRLEERFQKVLDKAFEIPVVVEPVKITLNVEKIQSLQAESEQVAAILKTDAESEPKPLYSDIAQVRTVWGQLDASSKYLLLAIYAGEITHLDGKTDGTAQAERVKNINMQSLRFLGDQIISIGDGKSLFIADDFKDEMELIARGNAQDDLRPKAGVEAAASTASSPWQAFLSALTSEERLLVQQFAAVGSMSESEIAAFARERNQMGNLMMDSIGEKAIEYTGNNPLYSEGDRLVFDEEALEQLHSILLVDGDINGNST
jgi:hypothetical protein